MPREAAVQLGHRGAAVEVDPAHLEGRRATAREDGPEQDDEQDGKGEGPEDGRAVAHEAARVVEDQGSQGAHLSPAALGR